MAATTACCTFGDDEREGGEEEGRGGRRGQGAAAAPGAGEVLAGKRDVRAAHPPRPALYVIVHNRYSVLFFQTCLALSSALMAPCVDVAGTVQYLAYCYKTHKGNMIVTKIHRRSKVAHTRPLS